MYFQKSYEPKRETSKSIKCEILEDSLHRVTLSAPEKKIPNGSLKINVASPGKTCFAPICKKIFFN